MPKDNATSQDLAERARQMREHEREARRRAPGEGKSDEHLERSRAGVPVFPVQKSPGS